MTPLTLAILNLSRKKFASSITLVALSLSVACAMTLLALHHLSEARFNSMARGGDAIVGAKAGGIEIILNCLNGEGPYPAFLPFSLVQTLRGGTATRFLDGQTTGYDYITGVIPLVFFGTHRGYRVAGTDKSFLFRPKVADALYLFAGRWCEIDGELVLGSRVAEELGVAIGDSLDVEHWIGDPPSGERIRMIVVGILGNTATTWDRMLFADIAQAHAVFSAHDDRMRDKSIWGSNVVHYMLVYHRPGTFHRLESMINKRTVGQAVCVEEQQQRLHELTGVGKKLGVFITALVILLGGLCAASMLVTRFEAMTLQMAILRALGYSKKELSLWLLCEGILLGIAGCTAGAVIYCLTFPPLRASLGSALPPPDVASVPLTVTLPVWIIAIVTTAVAVAIPLARLYRQDVHEALKGL